MIDAVFLDVGGVLVLPRHDLAREVLANVGHVAEPDDIDRAHYHGSAALAEWPEASSGTHSDLAIYEAFYGAYLQALGVRDHVVEEARSGLEAAFRRRDMWTQPAPGAHDGLRALAATDVAIAIVSNADGQIEDVLSDLHLCQVGSGPGVEVAAIIDSHVVGVAKPDPRIFEIALDRVGSAPERAVHVGDIVGADVAGAHAAGIEPWHYDPYGLCRADDHRHVASLNEVAELVTELTASP